MEDANVPKDIIFFHGAFVHYITPDESTAQPQDQSRTSASLRKLAGFSETHLVELSADMYDELQRRLSPDHGSGPLTPRKDIHWKRNDARKHVGSLPDHRFREICRDLVTEQERRYAELNTGPTYPLQDSMPMSDLRARRSQKSVADQPTGTPSPAKSTPPQSGRKPAVPLTVSTDQVVIQSVNESNVTPTKVRIIESDDSDDEYEEFERSSRSYVETPLKTRFDNKKLAESRTKEQNDSGSLASPVSKTESQGPGNVSEASAQDRSLNGSFSIPSYTSSHDDSVSKSREVLQEQDATRSDEESTDDEHDDEHDDKQNIGEPDNEPNADNEREVNKNDVERETKPEYQVQPLKDESDTYSEGSVKSAILAPLTSNKQATERLDSSEVPQTPVKGDASNDNGYPMSPPTSSSAAKTMGPSQVLEEKHDASSSHQPESSAPSEPHQMERSVSDNSQLEQQEKLAASLEHQRKITEQARREAAHFLDEMRALTKQHEEQISRGDNLDAEVKHWKDRHAKINDELSKLRQSRLDTAIKLEHLPDPLPESLKSVQGKATEAQLQRFFSSISVFVAAVHNRERSQDLLDLLHRVILSSRDISTEDKLIIRAAKQLISIVRNYTVSSGLFPRILVNSACSDLTMSVIEYVKEAKVRSDDENEQQSRSSSNILGHHSGSQFYTAPEVIVEDFSPESGSSTRNNKMQSRSSNADDTESSAREVPHIPNTNGQVSRHGSATAREVNVRAIEPEAVKEAEVAATPEHSLDEPATTDDSSAAQTLHDASEPETETRNIEQEADRPLSSESAKTGESQRQLTDSASEQTGEDTKSRPESGSSSSSTAVSANETRPRYRPQQGPEMPLDESVQSLQTYLEEQTSGTVEAIGALLAGIKSNAVAGELKPLMVRIQELVGDMVETTNKTMSETRSLVLKNKGSFIVENLQNCLDRMDMLKNDELDAIRDDARLNRHLKQRLAGMNFDMAKSTKELVKTVEEVVLQDEVDHIDRRLA